MVYRKYRIVTLVATFELHVIVTLIGVSCYFCEGSIFVYM